MCVSKARSTKSNTFEWKNTAVHEPNEAHFVIIQRIFFDYYMSLSDLNICDHLPRFRGFGRCNRMNTQTMGDITKFLNSFGFWFMIVRHVGFCDACAGAWLLLSTVLVQLNVMELLSKHNQRHAMSTR